MSSQTPLQLLSKSTRILNQVYGADKVFRLGVYGPKFIALLLMRYRGAENELAKKLIVFASQINNTRTVNRLFGLLDSIEMAVGAFEEKDPVSRIVAHIQAWSMILYHPLEHIYWLNEIGVLPSVNGDLASRYSCLSWLVYIILDIFSDVRRLITWYANYCELKRAQALLKQRLVTLNPKEEELQSSNNERRAQLKKEIVNLTLRFIKNGADMPMALHWSSPTALLSPLTVSFLGVVGSLSGGYYKWINS